MPNQVPVSRRGDIPYHFLFKPNSKRVKMEDPRQEELERQYQFLFNGYSHTHVYKVKDFNTFAGLTVKYASL